MVGVGHVHRLDAAVPELADVPADRDPLEPRPRLLLDDEGGDALLRPGGQGHEARPFAVGHPGLGAVEDVLLAVAPGAAGDVAGVAAGVGLREGQRPAALARRQRGEPALLLLLGPVRHDQRGRHGVRVDDAGQAHPAVRQLLDDPDVGQQVEAQASVRLRDGDAEQPEVAHLRHDLGGVTVGVLQFRGDGDDLTPHEGADRCDDLGPGCVVHRRRIRARHAGTAFLTAVTIDVNPVDAGSQFGEECFS